MVQNAINLSYLRFQSFSCQHTIVWHVALHSQSTGLMAWHTSRNIWMHLFGTVVTKIHTWVHNAVILVWGMLRLVPIIWKAAALFSRRACSTNKFAPLDLPFYQNKNLYKAPSLHHVCTTARYQIIIVPLTHLAMYKCPAHLRKYSNPWVVSAFCI